MKINYQVVLLAVALVFFTGVNPVKGQTTISPGQTNKETASKTKVKWSSNPFDHQVFIENKGQFQGPPDGDKILYGAQVGNVYLFITPHGLIYKYTERPEVKLSPDKKQYVMADPDDVDWKNSKPIDHYLTATWEGSTGNIVAVADKQQTYYYTYPGPDNKSTIKVNVFKTVTCQNVYPGIDIKYMFSKGKDGFKYTVIVHPGADLSVVKLKYSGAKEMKVDADGNIEINSGWGQFTDHAPVSYYGETDSTQLASGYQLNNNIESFSVNNLDVTKALTIDPWATNWTTAYAGNSGYDGAYDLDYDYAGNVYIYGGYNPFQLAKFNSAGVQQWTYNTSNFPYIYYGAFCVEKSSGASFCFEGFGGGSYAYTDKISTSGALLNTLMNNTLDEQWRAAYDLCSHTIAIAGGGISQSYQAATLDTNNNTYTQVNVLNLPPSTGYHDLCLIASDPIQDTTYMATTWTYANTSLDNNLLLRLPMPSLTPTGLMTYDGLNFQECYSPAYVATGSGNTNGMNGMAVSPDWLYTYDGDTLQQIDKSTGAINRKVNVSGTYFNWGGISVDLCDNIYLGNATNVDLYNSSLSYTGNIGPFPGNVYDVVLGNGVLASDDSTLYVCGKGFVSSVHIDPPSPPVITKSRTTICSCNCTATGILTFCGTPDTSSNVSYLWSNGQTTHTATSLCPGNTYTLTISLGCKQQFQDTFDIPPSGTITLVKSQTNTTCTSPGNASITVSGGNPPYTYLWSTGATTTSITGLSAGNYCVTVHDNTGCWDSACYDITSPPLPRIKATPSFDSICIGGAGIALTASGGVSYSWAPATGLSCTACANPTATPSVTTTYTVTGTDSNSCTNKDSVTIKVNPLPTITVLPNDDTVCTGGSIALSASGARSYVWSPPTALSCTNCSNPTVTPTATTTYTVTGTDSHGCSSNTPYIVYLQEPPAITVSASPSSICVGEPVTMTATASNTTSPYTWQPGSFTGPAISVTPSVTTTYTVTASSGCGTATAYQTINVNQLPISKFNAPVAMGCAPLCVQFRDMSTSQNTIVRWTWFLGNGDSINSRDPVYCYPNTGNYTVSLTTITDSGCSSTLSMSDYVTVYSAPAGNFTFSPQQTTIVEPAIQFNDLSTDVYGIVYRVWNFGEEGDTISNLKNPIHVYQDTGTFCPSLILLNQHGCSDTITNCLVIDPIFTLYIPSAFTPNGDSHNEIFAPKGNDIKSFEMYIFDRWGTQLFHSTDINNGWNGAVNGSGSICQEDTYVYIITVYDSKNHKHTYTGAVNLLK